MDAFMESTQDEQASLRGHWQLEEDEKLQRLVELHGIKKWNLIAREMEGRSGKSCRSRWLYQLDPRIKKGPFTLEEEEKLIKLQRKYGNKWASIAHEIPGRTDNAVKNQWHVMMKRQRRYRLGFYEQGSYEQYVSNAKEISNAVPTVPIRRQEENNNLKNFQFENSQLFAFRSHLENGVVSNFKHPSPSWGLTSLISSTTKPSWGFLNGGRFLKYGRSSNSFVEASGGFNQPLNSYYCNPSIPVQCPILCAGFTRERMANYVRLKDDLTASLRIGNESQPEVEDETSKNKKDIPFIDFLGVGNTC